MADTVTTQTIADTSGVKFVAKLTNFSDGTGETLVKKIDAAELTFMTEDGNMGWCYKCHSNVFEWSKSL